MTTSTHPATRITASANVPTIEIEREFDAPVAAVFRAHIDPDLVRQWLGPRTYAMRIDRYDARTGGSYRYVHIGDDGVEYGFFGAFHEVRPNERIVQTFTYEGLPDGVFLETATFEALGSRRTRLTILSVIDSFDARDGMIASGMESGVNEGYEQLDDLLVTG